MSSRLQKRIAESGLMSRRAAEEAIRSGRVLLNGRPAVLGESCTDADELLVDSRPIPGPDSRRVYMLNKPRGYVCTLHDEKGRKSVRELLPESAGRVYPVGRLDIMSEGLLLLTNYGELTFRLTHPSAQVLKTYRTKISSDDLETGIARMHRPFVLDGVTVCAKKIETLQRSADTAVLEITVGEGRNRQIRRMCEEAGLSVLRLIRVAEGPLRLGSLPTGSFRPLTDEEIDSLMKEST